jgi:hypothetical protein
MIPIPTGSTTKKMDRIRVNQSISAFLLGSTASRYTNNRKGSIPIAKVVEHAVMLMERGTFPFAQKEKTFEVDPPTRKLESVHSSLELTEYLIQPGTQPTTKIETRTGFGRSKMIPKI